MKSPVRFFCDIHKEVIFVEKQFKKILISNKYPRWKRMKKEKQIINETSICLSIMRATSLFWSQKIAKNLFTAKRSVNGMRVIQAEFNNPPQIYKKKVEANWKDCTKAYLPLKTFRIDCSYSIL